MGEYNALLGLYNIDVKHVKGEKFGKEYNGGVYSAKNDRGQIVSNPFKSSLFGKSFGFERLNNTEIMSKKDMTVRSKAVVSTAMRATGTREEFEKALRGKSMDVVFRTNDTGRVYGVTFIDHENKAVLNGSRLGKDFSANVFHEWFNSGKKPAFSVSEKADVPVKIPAHQHRHSVTEAVKSFDTSTMEELFGVFDMKPHGEDYEENAFARRMRRKKKQQKKRI
jgi:hypothetical protein